VAELVGNVGSVGNGAAAHGNGAATHGNGVGSRAALPRAEAAGGDGLPSGEAGDKTSPGPRSGPGDAS